MATAFAIFCADDGSLTFYKRDTVPAVGDEFEGKVVSNVYEGFETKKYASNTIIWLDNMAAIVSVSFVDEISPEYTSHWFYGASSMTSFDGTNLNVLNVSAMTSMFNGCSSLATLDLSSFDTSNVTGMDRMFFNCSSLTSLDLSSFDTSKVANMFYMFRDCSSLTSLDLSSFDTSKVANMESMFNGCSNLSSIYVSDLWTTAATTSNRYMFYNCKSLTGAIPFDSTVVDATHANYQTGYLTYKFYADYLKNRFVIDGAELSDIGDKIRTLTGGKEGMAPSAMKTGLDNVSSEVDAQADLIAQIQEIVNKSKTRELIDRSVTSIDLTGVETIRADAFNGCVDLVYINCPNVTKINSRSFAYCYGLSLLDFPNLTYISQLAFLYCSHLKSLILRNTTQVCTLEDTRAFSASSISSGTGYIYVPSTLVDSYKAATGWSTYASQIRAIEDYPDVCEQGGESI